MNPAATLARPYTADIDAFIRERLDDINYYYWMDLNDLKDAGHFTFSNGDVPSYTNWWPGHPTAYGGHCVLYWRPSAGGYLWINYNCNDIDNYVCQMNAVVS